jgi:hypothetical protein
MSNRPYEQYNDSIVPKIGMTGILGASAYTLYKVNREPEGWLGGQLTNILDKVMPLTNPSQTPLQRRISNIADSIDTGLKRGMEMKKATYAHRDTSMIEKINSINSVGLKETGIDITAEEIARFSNGSTVHGVNLNKGVYSIDNVDVQSKVLENLKKLGITATREDAVGASTSLSVKIGNHSVEVPLAKFDEETGAWIVRNKEGAHYVAPYFRRPTLEGKNVVGSEFMSYNEYVLDMISNNQKALITANSGNARDVRDVLHYDDIIRKGTKGKDAAAHVKMIESKTNAERIVKDFHEMHGIKQLFKNLSSHLLWAEGNSPAKIQRLGRTVKNDIYGLHEMENAGLRGAMESNVSLNSLHSIEPEAINAVAGMNEVARGNANNKFRGIHSPIQQQINEFIGYNVSQSQGAMWTSTFFPTMTKGNGIDSLKSMKDFKFHGRFGENIDKNLPLVWSHLAQGTNPLAYGQVYDQGHATMLGVINPHTEEVIQFAPGLKDNMRVSRAIEMKAKTGYTWGGLPSEKQAMTKLMNPTYIIGGESHSDKTLFDLYNDTKTLSQVERIELRPGTVVGLGTANNQIDTAASYDRAMSHSNGLVTTNTKVIQTKEDIARTLRGFGEGTIEKTFYGQSVEALTKVGTYHDLRSAAQLMPQETAALYGKNVSFDMSLDFFKKVFPSSIGKDGIDGIIAGKGAGSMLTTLQSMVAGHAYAAEKDVVLNENLTKSLSKYVGGFTGNLTQLARQGRLQFDQGAGPMKEQINLMTRLLGHMRGGSQDISYNDAADLMTDHLQSLGDKTKNINQFHIMSTIFPQESLYTQGIGHNVYRMGVNDMPYLLPSKVMEELAGSSLTDSRKILSEGQMYMNFMKDPKLAGQMEKTGVKVLNKEGLEEMLADGKIIKGGNIDDPYLMTKSFLNPDVNAKGFGVATEDGRLAYFGSGDFYQKSQYLDDEERLAVSRDVRLETQILVDAKNNGGVISSSNYQKLIDIRATGNMASKEGYLRRGAFQVEGASLDKVFADTHLINNKELIGSIEEGSKLDHLFGNTTVIDKETYASSIADELQKSYITAKDNNKTISSFLEDRFGKGNIFEKHYADIASGDKFKQVGHSIAQQSVKDYDLLHSLVQSGQHDKAASLIERAGQSTFVDRFPNIYSSSKALSFTFATDKGYVEGGKFIAFGHRLRTLMNADNDGDIAFAKFLFHTQNRSNVYDRILKEQSMSHDVINAIKENKKNSLQAIFNNESKNYFLPHADRLDDLTKAMAYSEKESVTAAWLTKRTTGSAHVRTKEMTNAMMSKIIGNSSLSEEQQMNAMIHAIDIPAKEIVQGSISSKHVEKMLGVTNKIDHMVANMGELTKEKALTGFAELQGEVGALHLYNTLNAVQNRNGEVPAFLREGSKNNVKKEFETLTNIHTMFKREGATEVENALKLLPGFTPELAKTRAAAYVEKTKGMTFTNETEAFKNMGYTTSHSYFDFIEDLKKTGHFSASESYDAVIRQHRDSEEGFFKGLLGDSNLQRHLGHESFINPELHGSIVKGISKREIYGAEQVRNLMGKITPGKVGLALGAGLVAMTALNVLGGDGTPEDINDLPSVSNPSFGDSHRGYMGTPRQMGSSMGNNMHMGLLTDRRENHNDSISSISAAFGGRLNNTVSVRSDGTDPYKSDMHQYRG